MWPLAEGFPPGKGCALGDDGSVCVDFGDQEECKFCAPPCRRGRPNWQMLPAPFGRNLHNHLRRHKRTGPISPPLIQLTPLVKILQAKLSTPRARALGGWGGRQLAPNLWHYTFVKHIRSLGLLTLSFTQTISPRFTLLLGWKL